MSRAVVERGAKTSFNASTESAGPAGKFDNPDAAPPNAPALREMDGLAVWGERQIGAPHRTAAPASDPFVALDQERAAPAATWIHTGAHRAEAGYLDPALGWIGVRADTAANGVHAALVPASAEAAKVLGSHLAGLNAYLSEHHREPATVTLTAPQDGLAPQGCREGMGTASGSGDRPSAGHQDSQTRQSRNDGPPVAEISGREKSLASGTTAVRAPAGAGKYISVMA